jgi:hypothetical protein
MPPKHFDLAGKGALIMGGAIVAGLGLAVSKSMEFEKSMSAVAAATQATGGTLEALRAAAIKAGADTAYSATEAADGITEMAKAGVSAKDIMGGGLRGALSLAAAGSDQRGGCCRDRVHGDDPVQPVGQGSAARRRPPRRWRG